MAQKPVGGGGSAATYAGFGIQFLVAILVFAYAGSWVDKHLGTGPLFLIVGVFAGAAGTFYSMYRRLMSDSAATRNREGR